MHLGEIPPLKSDFRETLRSYCLAILHNLTMLAVQGKNERESYTLGHTQILPIIYSKLRSKDEDCGA